MIEKYKCIKCGHIAHILVADPDVLSNVICLNIIDEKPCKGKRIKI